MMEAEEGTPKGIYIRLKTTMSKAYFSTNMDKNLEQFRAESARYLEGPGQYKNLTFLQICENLEGNGDLGFDKLDIMKVLTRSATDGRAQLLQMIDKAQNDIQRCLSGVMSRPKLPWNQINLFLSKKLSGEQNYKMALRSIMSQSDYQDGDLLISEHYTNHPRDVKEVIYQVLSDWNKTCNCTLDMVIRGLEEQNLVSIAQELMQHELAKPFLQKENSATS